jgi:hypothetical protein
MMSHRDFARLCRDDERFFRRVVRKLTADVEKAQRRLAGTALAKRIGQSLTLGGSYETLHHHGSSFGGDRCACRSRAI